MAEMDLTKLKIDKSLRSSAPLKRRGRAVWWLALAAVLIALLIAVIVVARPVTVESATVSLVYPSQTFTLLNASGYVVAQRKAAVASKASSRLEWLGVEEGSRVRKGEIIARLERQDVLAARDQAAANIDTARASMEQTRAELNDATLNFKRMQDLLPQGVVSQSDFDTAEARYRRAKAALDGSNSAIVSAQAALQSAEVAIEYTLIRAPFDAVVLTKDADVGDIVTPLGAAANAKAAVVTIADMRSLLVEADVSEANLEKVRVGQPCELQLDALPEARFRGVVHMIVPTADRSKASVMVKVRFDNIDSRILPEMSAKVAFLERAARPDEQQPKMAVSPTAIASLAGNKVLFVIKGERVTTVEVKVGKPIGELVEVSGPLKAGDKVVLKPLAKMKNGMRVKLPEQ